MKQIEKSLNHVWYGINENQWKSEIYDCNWENENWHPTTTKKLQHERRHVLFIHYILNMHEYFPSVHSNLQSSTSSLQHEIIQTHCVW